MAYFGLNNAINSHLNIKKDYGTSKKTNDGGRKIL